ncbi:uncharacterized protein N7498_000039 [Penicillium cinerascens]|uniref:FAD-binding domain-containing protein n=1 Tax=Penicillium cinerascens TaxID=70096 RepID=A0A9W9TDV9_9EURO|nr:uncharacterized protein N7498_000039 [Penicillium cinerascens]KAJ5217940.1 hypothetical protein N7498_000039 [Penicillium cinerascens]
MATVGETPKLKFIVVGAGIGGLGAAIALLLAGHNVQVLEAAKELGEVGAGIQILPNGARVLRSWGMEPALAPKAMEPSRSNMRNWKGDLLTSWDFHRADLHLALVDRTIELGGDIVCSTTVSDVECDSPPGQATVQADDGKTYTADMVLGADGVHSKLRAIMSGRDEPPTPTGDLAYRLLLDASVMLSDPELAEFVTDPQVNLWIGPETHIVNYVLRQGTFFNMVLCMPDDIPEMVRVAHGNIEELKVFYKDWDPRIVKLINISKTADKWKLCIRDELDRWYHPSGTFALLGDAVHATLPYLSSGAGMTLEDAAVLGECLTRIRSKSPSEIRHALAVYQKCRKQRTERIVKRSSLQQHLSHLPDGPEQEQRDVLLRIPGPVQGEAFVWRDPDIGPWLLSYDHVQDVTDNWGLKNDIQHI